MDRQSAPRRDTSRLLGDASLTRRTSRTPRSTARPDDLVSTAILLTALAAAALIWLLHGRTSVERAYTLGVTLGVAAVGSLAYVVLTG